MKHIRLDMHEIINIPVTENLLQGMMVAPGLNPWGTVKSYRNGSEIFYMGHSSHHRKGGMLMLAMTLWFPVGLKSEISLQLLTHNKKKRPIILLHKVIYQL